jgi:hypothetical protein
VLRAGEDRPEFSGQDRDDVIPFAAAEMIARCVHHTVHELLAAHGDVKRTHVPDTLDEIIPPIVWGTLFGSQRSQ